MTDATVPAAPRGMYETIEWRLVLPGDVVWIQEWSAWARISALSHFVPAGTDSVRGYLVHSSVSGVVPHQVPGSKTTIRRVQ